jgi:hypothetical protein
VSPRRCLRRRSISAGGTGSELAPRLQTGLSGPFGIAVDVLDLLARCLAQIEQDILIVGHPGDMAGVLDAYEEVPPIGVGEGDAGLPDIAGHVLGVARGPA